MVAVVSDKDPFKYAESNQTANSTGKKSFSGSVSLSFSSPKTGAVTVTNLSTPIRITIPHPPMLDNETVECRYWDPILLEQRTDGCELVASFTNYSVCACDHLTDFSMGTWNKFKDLEVTLPRLPYTDCLISPYSRRLFMFGQQTMSLLHIFMPTYLPQNIMDTEIEELLPSIEPLTAEVKLFTSPG
jgi:hypothetical protein